ncbi:MAG: hypothetical protein ABI693_23520 [Bryobacteraceae bacterium]
MSEIKRSADSVGFFAGWERLLASQSHSDEAARIIETAVAERFKKTAQRQIAFAEPGAICIQPIVYEDALATGAIDASEDWFVLLQGDVVTTQSAYWMGNRLVGEPLFAVLSATCDLVPGRREFASLLRRVPITGDPEALEVDPTSSAVVPKPTRPLFASPAGRELTLVGLCNPLRWRRPDPP